MTTRSQRGSRARLCLAAALALAAFASRLAAADFIRGDANGDGQVSIADAHKIFSFLFRFGPLGCIVSGDADDDSDVDIVDGVRIVSFTAGLSDAPPAPYPAAGTDPTPSGDAFLDSCDSYGGGSIVEDASYGITVLDATAAGGDDNSAKIRIAVTNPAAIAGLSGVLRVEGAAGEIVGAVARSADSLAGPIDSSRQSLAGLTGDRIAFAYITSISEALTLDPGEDVALLELSLCLAGGLPAGDHALVLEEGEIVEPMSARAIRPALASGVLHVEAAISEELSCETGTVDPPADPVDIVYTLGDAVAPPSGTTSVTLTMRSNGGIQGWAVSIDFDETILVATSAEAVWNKPAGSDPDYGFLHFELDNDDATAGSGGIDEGFIVGAAVFDFLRPVSLPADSDIVVARFRFDVKDGIEAVETPIRFIDGGVGAGDAVRNQATVAGRMYTPETADSFLLIDSFLNVLPDITIFIRGDSNSDQTVDISDAQATLAHLFLGTRTLACADAGDANDDGTLNITDPVATLGMLFLGAPDLPPPFPGPGTDPTEDALECLPSVE